MQVEVTRQSYFYPANFGFFTRGLILKAVSLLTWQ